MLTIVPPKSGSKHPLLLQRFGELSLPAYVELDLENRIVSFTYSSRNEEPIHVTLGHARRWRIDSMISRRAATKLANELELLFERLCNGYASHWDGRNHVGVLDVNAQAAAKQIESRLKERLFPEAV